MFIIHYLICKCNMPIWHIWIFFKKYSSQRIISIIKSLILYFLLFYAILSIFLICQMCIIKNMRSERNITEISRSMTTEISPKDKGFYSNKSSNADRYRPVWLFEAGNRQQISHCRPGNIPCLHIWYQSRLYLRSYWWSSALSPAVMLRYQQYRHLPYGTPPTHEQYR